MKQGVVREVERASGDPALATDVLGGAVVVVRRGLQQAELLDTFRDATCAGLARVLGSEAAQAIAAAGFDRLHEHVAAADLPGVTESVYGEMTRRAPELMSRIARTLFGTRGTLYFEAAPNVRFHIPYDIAAAHRRAFDAYAATRGQGKIAAHAPHRDPWLDCPDDVINIWIAVGPVRSGNGLTIFPESYRARQAFTRNGEIARHERLTRPVTFDLAPGDLVLFHGNHLHGSELNRTAATRYVVSFRFALDRPHFPYGHYHTYLHSGLAGGPLRFMAAWPANLQWSYVRSLAARIVRKLGGDRRADPSEPAERFADEGSIAMADLPVGEVRAVSPTACIARLAPDRFVAVSRRCPHRGADLANGFVIDGALVCPWHNVPFDPGTGASACASLQPIARYALAVESGRVRIADTKPLPGLAPRGAPQLGERRSGIEASR